MLLTEVAACNADTQGEILYIRYEMLGFDVLTFQFFVVFVVHMSVRIAALA